ncbi:hypothetical protein AB1Y20_015317 [Prymnesium parvum]|uniref:Rab-GAP TBC domain-containing protein n=1 Tax=Prymnesium parvum TaxID=97485 RepID=A0AB34K0D7_PRYPA
MAASPTPSCVGRIFRADGRWTAPDSSVSVAPGDWLLVLGYDPPTSAATLKVFASRLEAHAAAVVMHAGPSATEAQLAAAAASHAKGILPPLPARTLATFCSEWSSRGHEGGATFSTGVADFKQRTAAALSAARDRARPSIAETVDRAAAARERAAAALAAAQRRAAPKVEMALEQLRERVSHAREKSAPALEKVGARLSALRLSAAERVRTLSAPSERQSTASREGAGAQARVSVEEPAREHAAEAGRASPPPPPAAEGLLIDFDGPEGTGALAPRPVAAAAGSTHGQPELDLLYASAVEPLGPVAPHSSADLVEDALSLLLGQSYAAAAATHQAAGAVATPPPAAVEVDEEAVERAVQLLRSSTTRGISAEGRQLLASLSPLSQGAVWASMWSVESAAAEYDSCLQGARELRATLEYDWDESYRKQHVQLCNDLDVIQEDVPRTFLEQGPQYRASTPEELTEVLEAHVTAEARLGAEGLGYVQGMADVAAFLLQRLPPKQTFTTLRALCGRPICRLIFRLDVDEWLLVSTIFSSLLGVCCPQTFSRLDEFELEPAMYLPEWLMPLWTRSLDPRVVAHVFNLLTLEGDGILIRAALAICAAIEPLLLTATEMPTCRRCLSEAPAGVGLELFCEMLDKCAIGDEALAPLMRPLTRRATC